MILSNGKVGSRAHRAFGKAASDRQKRYVIKKYQVVHLNLLDKESHAA